MHPGEQRWGTGCGCSLSSQTRAAQGKARGTLGVQEDFLAPVCTMQLMSWQSGSIGTDPARH